VVAVGTRQGHEDLVPTRSHAPSRALLRDRLRRLATEAGLTGVPQVHLQPGAHNVLDLLTHVIPPLGADHQVHPVGQGPRHHLLDTHVHVVKIGPEAAPAVHHQEDVPVAVVEPPLGPALAVGGDRVDPVSPEVALPVR